jgi:fluoride exporter
MKSLLVVAAGGALGSMGRYLATIYISRHTNLTFPMGTFVVNVTGCFLIGILFGLFAKHAVMTTDWRLFLITGICGGYTTFSSFSLESIALFRQGSYTYFLLYTFGSVILGLLATVAGMTLTR